MKWLCKLLCWLIYIIPMCCEILWLFLFLRIFFLSPSHPPFRQDRHVVVWHVNTVYVLVSTSGVWKGRSLHISTLYNPQNIVMKEKRCKRKYKTFWKNKSEKILSYLSLKINFYMKKHNYLLFLLFMKQHIPLYIFSQVMHLYVEWTCL